MNKKDYISREDYEEPRCLLNMHPEVVSIPVGRVIEKLDSYLNQNDYSSAERHLEYWLSEAEAGEDDRGENGVPSLEQICTLLQMEFQGIAGTFRNVGACG